MFHRLLLLFLFLDWRPVCDAATDVLDQPDTRHPEWFSWAGHVSQCYRNYSHILESPLRFRLYLSRKAVIDAQNERFEQGLSSWTAALHPILMMLPGEGADGQACEPETRRQALQLQRMLA